MASATPAGAQHDTTAMATGATPSFLGVPAELFERFAQFAKPKDLLALRLTCKYAAEKVLRTYTEVHFSHRHILLTEETNLRHAIEVAQHPIFGPALKKLSIHTDEICLAAEPPSFIMLTREAIRGHPPTSDEHRELLSRQDRFRDAKLDLYLLTILLAQIRVQNAHPHIEMDVGRQDQHSKLHIDGMSDGLEFRWSQVYPYEYFMKSLEAILLSNLEVSSLNLFLNVPEFSSRQLGIMAAGLQNIKRLHIMMIPQAFDRDFELRICQIFKILASTKVEFLSMSFATYLGSTCIAQLLLQRFAHLRELTLDASFPCDKDLVMAFAEFIRLHPALQALCLKQIIVRVSEDFLLNSEESISAAFQRHTGFSQFQLDRPRVSYPSDSSPDLDDSMDDSENGSEDDSEDDEEEDG